MYFFYHQYITKPSMKEELRQLKMEIQSKISESYKKKNSAFNEYESQSVSTSYILITVILIY